MKASLYSIKKGVLCEFSVFFGGWVEGGGLMLPGMDQLFSLAVIIFNMQIFLMQHVESFAQ